MPPAARGASRGAPAGQRGGGAHTAGRGVTSTDIACLVHAYLTSHGFHSATAAFETDAQALLAPVLASAPPPVKQLSEILAEYVDLLSREGARQALCASNPVAQAVYGALEAQAGGLTLVPPQQPAQQQQQQQQQVYGQRQETAYGGGGASDFQGWETHGPVDPPPPYGVVARSPHGRKPPAPRKRQAQGRGAARNVRFALDGASGGHEAPLMHGRYMAMMNEEMDPEAVERLMRDPDQLMVFSEQLARQLPPVNELEDVDKSLADVFADDGLPLTEMLATMVRHPGRPSAQQQQQQQQPHVQAQHFAQDSGRAGDSDSDVPALPDDVDEDEFLRTLNYG